jgi:hypothetical protein
MDAVPVSAAKWVAHAFGYDQVVIIARKVGDDGAKSVTTYGVDSGHCEKAARTGSFLKKNMSCEHSAA